MTPKKRESKRQSAQSQPSKEVLRRLQEMLVKSILLGETLRGHDQPIRFPDSGFLERQSAIYLVNENLAGSLSIEGLPKELRILSNDALLQIARKQGDVTYLHFQAPKKIEGKVTLTLEAKIMTPNPNQPMLGLSGIQVEFQNVGGQWQAVGESRSFAA